MNLAILRDIICRHGLKAGVHDVAKKAVNRVVTLRMLRTLELTMARLDRSYLALPEGLDGSFADEARLLRWAENPESDLDVAFVREALAKGDRCYAITQGGTLASYGWYSRRPTMITRELRLHFDPTHVYMYKGFTHPAFRGQRLHAVGMAHALEAYVAEGCTGIVSYVESNNFASLRSCYRMGYTDVGRVIIAIVNGHTLSRASAPNVRLGLRVEVVPAHAAQKIGAGTQVPLRQTTGAQQSASGPTSPQCGSIVMPPRGTTHDTHLDPRSRNPWRFDRLRLR